MRLASSFAEIWLSHWQHKPSQGGHIRVLFRRLSAKLESQSEKIGSFFRFFVMQKRPWHGIMLASWMSHDVTEASTETGPKPATFLLLWAEEAVKRLVQARDVTPTYIPTCCTCQLTNFSVFFLATLAWQVMQHLCIYLNLYLYVLFVTDTQGYIMAHKLWWLCQLPFDCMERMYELKKLQASWGAELSRTYQAERRFGQTSLETRVSNPKNQRMKTMWNHSPTKVAATELRWHCEGHKAHAPARIGSRILDTTLLKGRRYWKCNEFWWRGFWIVNGACARSPTWDVN